MLSIYEIWIIRHLLNNNIQTTPGSHFGARLAGSEDHRNIGLSVLWAIVFFFLLFIFKKLFGGILPIRLIIRHA